MCGICGILGNGIGEKDINITREMMGVLAHRGPDGEGLSHDDHYVFGHRRLAIIDVVTGQQPMFSADGRYVLTYNGEIYNYIELRGELEKKGAVFKTSSDSEVLLQALIYYGENVLERLDGMFAFAFHDTAENTTILARDHFGIKPLYYTVLKGGKVMFASEIKALLLHPDVEAKRSAYALQQYLTFQYCLGDLSLFEGIHKLKPGQFMRLKNGVIDTIQSYWEADYTIDEHHTGQYFEQRLDELLNQAVKRQLRSDVPLGAYLSGGLDSSIITALASKHLDTPIDSFHGLFSEGPQYDESDFAKAVCERTGAQYNETVPSAQEFVDDLPKLIYALDEPAAGPGVFPQYKVSQSAASKVKVVLGGQGGDEIFGGYTRYVVGYLEQALKGAIYETQEEGKHLVTLGSIVPNMPILKQYVPMLKHFWSEGLFEDMDRRYFRLIDRSPDAAEMLESGVYPDDVREKIFEDYCEDFNRSGTLSYINKMTHFDLQTVVPALLQIEDRVSMAVSLESRVPLLNKDIVSLVASMPPAMKFAGGRTKHILKEVSKPYLPEKVVYRKDKMGFPVPLKEWMENGPVRDFVLDTLFSQAARQRGIFKPDVLEKLVKKEFRFGRQIWGALSLELWHQIYIDQSLSKSNFQRRVA